MKTPPDETPYIINERLSISAPKVACKGDDKTIYGDVLVAQRDPDEHYVLSLYRFTLTPQAHGWAADSEILTSLRTAEDYGSKLLLLLYLSKATG